MLELNELECLCFYTNAMDLTKNKFEKRITKSQFTKNQGFKKKNHTT